MKTIVALSSAVLLFAILGCAGPAETPDASKATEDAAQTSTDPATEEAGAIQTMDFESGEVPENAPADEAAEPTEQTDEDESTVEGDGQS